MKNTTNYGLMKPDATDLYDVQIFNVNADIVDTKLKELKDGFTGSYIGNGDATSRTIDTGGVGDALAVWAGSYNYVAIVLPQGAIVAKDDDDSATFIKNPSAKYNNGVLTLATTDVILNGSSYTYYYRVL